MRIALIVFLALLLLDSEAAAQQFIQSRPGCSDGYLGPVIGLISKESPTYTRCEELMMSTEKFAYAASSTLCSVGKLYGDYWATGTGNGAPDLLTTGDFTNIQFDCPSASTTTFNDLPSVSCGNGYTELPPPNGKNTITSFDTSRCLQLADKGISFLNNTYEFRKAYDTLRTYIELCHEDKDAYHFFSGTTSAVVGMADEGTKVWAQYRDWLKSVLYLNPDYKYYCYDLLEYAGTFENADELGHPSNFKTTLSIYRYLTDSSKCTFMHEAYDATMKYYNKLWKDSVTDSLKTPFDTTLPNIDQIGAGWLRGFANVEQGNLNPSGNSIGELQATKNPFTDEIELKYTVTKGTIAKIEIYDALGRMLWTDGQGYLESREHTVRIASKEWSSGTYYARIVTLQGEVKSCKLVKE